MLYCRNNNSAWVVRRERQSLDIQVSIYRAGETVEFGPVLYYYYYYDTQTMTTKNVRTYIRCVVSSGSGG